MLRHQLPAQTRLDATGAGSVTITARHPLAVFHTRVSVAPLPGQAKPVNRPSAVVYLNGLEFEDTQSGWRDQSATAYELDAGDTVECRWTGGDPGALATLIIRGSS